MSESESAREGADRVYRELLARVGESMPQPRLEPTRRAVDLLGNPQRAYPVIHVTGTNGKTSTCRIAESILRAHGLRTGLMVSPHLISVNERIVIDGEPISDEALVRNWDDITVYLGMVDAELEAAGEERLTYFEALTVLAFACFADAPVDVVVLEVGMGGEWDSTNVADGEVAVFAPIALDHTHRLGDTVGEIAATKAGIIKPAARVVSAVQQPEAIGPIALAAERFDATVAWENRDFGVVSSRVGVGGQVVTIRGLAAQYDELVLPLLGEHQAHNAALAVAAVESFLGGGAKPIERDVLVDGLALATSPGRLQLLGTEPPVLIDAAHNPHGAQALAKALGDYFNFVEVVLVVGILADKDAGAMIEILAPLANRIHVTQSHSDRAIPADELADDVEYWSAGRWEAEPGEPEREIERFAELDEALAAARLWAVQASGRGVVVTGSITLVGEAMALAALQGWSTLTGQEEGDDFE